MTGSLTLYDHPGNIVHLACNQCGRAGQYRKQNLIERFGADVRLPDLREEIARCQYARQMHNMCGAYYVGLIGR